MKRKIAQEEKKKWKATEYVRDIKCLKRCLNGDIGYLPSSIWYNRTPEVPDYWRNMYIKGTLTDVAKRKIERYISKYEEETNAVL